MLCADDRARADRTSNLSEKSAFVAGRMVLSKLMERATREDAAAIKFSTVNGRPTALDYEDRSLSVSKSHEQVAAAVATAPMGIDLEKILPHTLDDDVAETMFHPTERARLRALTGQRKAREFFKIWTQKEAFSKAHGAGTALDYSKICVSENGGRIIVPRGCALNRTWHSQFVESAPEYVLAIVSSLQKPKIEIVNWPIKKRD